MAKVGKFGLLGCGLLLVVGSCLLIVGSSSQVFAEQEKDPFVLGSEQADWLGFDPFSLTTSSPAGGGTSAVAAPAGGVDTSSASAAPGADSSLGTKGEDLSIDILKGPQPRIPMRPQWRSPVRPPWT